MIVALRLINSVLILVTAFVSFRAGWWMLNGKQEFVDVFTQWEVKRGIVIVFALITMFGSILLFHPKSYVTGSYFMLLTILFLIVQYLHVHQLKGILIELPWFIAALIILYLPHPLDLILHK